MKELLQQAHSKKEEERRERLVYLFVNGKEYVYSGDWQWKLRSHAVFCSDVMLTLPTEFEGTRSIIHPEDKACVVEQVLASDSKNIPFLQFRIITTYGDVLTLAGKNLQMAEVDPLYPEQAAAQQAQKAAAHTQITTQQIQRTGWQKRAGELAERLTGCGTWYYHADSSSMYYSDEVFRIYGLPRQSLNAHLGTFSPFIHPDDRDAVAEAFTKALQERVPLHLDFRIITGSGQEKLIHQATHWEYDSLGRLMLYGAIQEITSQHAIEQQLQTDRYSLLFKDKLLQLNEQTSRMGHWYVNLVTRKVHYSDTMYRLYGIKPGSIQFTGNIFLNYVHPEDRDLIAEVHKKILHEHVPPDIDFRIVRNDGKVRYLRQQGKLMVYGESEMVMLVTVQDISGEVVTTQKLAALKEQVMVRQFALQQAEEMAGMGNWNWELESEIITWSESLYHLLGYKPGDTAATHKHLMQAIHTDDRKKFADGLKLILDEKQESKFEFRILRCGEVRHLCASFKILPHGEKDLFISIFQDITGQHNIRQQLSAQTHLSAIIAENMLDRAVITNTENTIEVWNKRSEETYKIKKEDAIGKNIFDVLPQLKNEEDMLFFNRALQGETIFVQHKKASVRQEYHDLHMIPLKDAENQVTGVLHLLHDVTYQREMQQRLSERLNFIESLVEASVDRIIVMDRYMNYLYCNGKAAAYYKLNKEDIIGKNVLEVFPATVGDLSFEHFRRALKGETVHIPAIEGFIDEHHFELYLIPIKDAGGNITAVLWMHHDLVGDIKFQHQLKKSDD